MNRLSYVIMKKLPLFPEPSPILNTSFWFKSGEKLFSSKPNPSLLLSKSLPN